MSVRNGDQSKLNRERKKKVARRKRIHELPEHAAQPRSVWA